MNNSYSLNVPKLGILTSAHGQIIHQLVLDQLLLLQKLQRSSQLLRGQTQPRRHVIITQVLVPEEDVDEADDIVVVEGTCDGGD